MKYCLKYSNKCTRLEDANEISIKYIADRSLVEFMEKFNSKRLILFIERNSEFDAAEIRKLSAIKSQYPEYDFTVGLSEVDMDLMKQLRKAAIPFYIAKPCLDWETFNFLIKQGVSDIDISGPLGFEMSKVKRVLETLEQKVIVRATPNKITNILPTTETIEGFFIRPEDMFIYDGYIDVLEFEGLEHQDTFYTIYAERGTFIGNLDQCIYGLKSKADNKGLVTLFGERRRDCGRQCLSGGLCNRCNTLADLSLPMGARAREKIMETVKKEQEKLKK